MKVLGYLRLRSQSLPKRAGLRRESIIIIANYETLSSLQEICNSSHYFNNGWFTVWNNFCSTRIQSGAAIDFSGSQAVAGCG